MNIRKEEPMKKSLVLLFTVLILFISQFTVVAAAYDGWSYESGNWYYYASGKKVTGWIKDDGKWYYLDNNGVMKTGWVYLNHKWYYLSPSGAMKTGWHLDGGKWYYLQSDGSMATGWLDLNEEKYYFRPDGSMVTGWREIDGLLYYFSPSGKLIIGSKPSGDRYIFVKADGTLARGWYWLGDAWYFFNEGHMQTGWLEEDHAKYYFKSDGRMVTKWASIDGNWYYFNSSGIMQTGWQTINHKTYYFLEDGKMATGWIEIESKLYYFDKNGENKTGWIQDYGSWYYLTEEGKKLTGLKKIGDQYYYFDADGVMQTGWQEINGEKYYFKSFGPMSTGWGLIDGHWYYFNTNGIMQTGWQKIDGSWYYLNPDKGFLHTGWLKDGGSWYYFDPNGVMQTGWLEIEGRWYYFYSSGVMKTGWLQYGDNWYYFYPSGALKTGWLQIDEYWYYFDSSGAMQTGLTKIGDYYYFFYENGRWDGKPGKKLGINYTQYNKDFSTVLNIQVSVKDAPPKVDGAGQFIASKKLVEYYLNPANFEAGTPEFYQFLDLSVPLDLTSEQVKKIDEKILNQQGILHGKAWAFIEAGKQHNINVIYLIVHALHETDHGKSLLSTGIEVGKVGDNKYVSIIKDSKGNERYYIVDGNNNVYEDKNFQRSQASEIKTTYNMFGIGAYDLHANVLGSVRAYQEGWFTPEEAIKGGAKFIAERYIYRKDNTKNTLYKMKWNPEAPGTYQYATHVQWAVIQARNLAKYIEDVGITDLVFDVPVYNNQPAKTTEPQGAERYAVLPVSDGLTAITSASNGLRLREFPVSGNTVVLIPHGTKVNILGTNGGWYKVNVTINSTEYTGWVSGSYLSFN